MLRELKIENIAVIERADIRKRLPQKPSRNRKGQNQQKRTFSR